ncbi:MAG: tripartite tricarboxylate transporter TctB family protein [Peptococcaceae bacterium]
MKLLIPRCLFPKIFAWVLVLIGLWRLVFFMIKGTDKNAVLNVEQIDMIKLLAGTVVIFAYVILLPLLGYLITTTVSIFLLIYLLGKPKVQTALLCSLAATVVIWTVFDKFLHVPLPSGFLGIWGV